MVVVGLLDHADRMGIVDEVLDECEIWENRKFASLKSELSRWYSSTAAASTGPKRNLLGEEVVPMIIKFPGIERFEASGPSDEADSGDGEDDSDKQP